MNTNANPAAASDLSSRDNPCYGRDSTVATLNVFADDERSYQLPYAQFLYAERIPNPALEKDFGPLRAQIRVKSFRNSRSQRVNFDAGERTWTLSPRRRPEKLIRCRS